MSVPEKCCTLANAMTKEADRQRVLYYQALLDGYTSAVKALQKEHDRPGQAYARYVNNFRAKNYHTYDRLSIRNMREKVVFSMQNMDRLGGKDLETFIAAMVLEDCSQRMRDEWISHSAHGSKLPTITELIVFFQTRENRLDDYSSDHRNTKSFTPTATNSHKPPHQTSLRVNTSSKSVDGTSSTTGCPVCSRNHPLHKCGTFLSYNTVRRGQVVKDVPTAWHPTIIVINALQHTTARDVAGDAIHSYIETLTKNLQLSQLKHQFKLNQLKLQSKLNQLKLQPKLNHQLLPMQAPQ